MLQRRELLEALLRHALQLDAAQCRLQLLVRHRLVRRTLLLLLLLLVRGRRLLLLLLWRGGLRRSGSVGWGGEGRIRRRRAGGSLLERLRRRLRVLLLRLLLLCKVLVGVRSRRRAHSGLLRREVLLEQRGCRGRLLLLLLHTGVCAARIDARSTVWLRSTGTRALLALLLRRSAKHGGGRLATGVKLRAARHGLLDVRAGGVGLWGLCAVSGPRLGARRIRAGLLCEGAGGVLSRIEVLLLLRDVRLRRVHLGSVPASSSPGERVWRVLREAWWFNERVNSRRSSSARVRGGKARRTVEDLLTQ